MDDGAFSRSGQKSKIGFTGLAIGALYWVVESCVEAALSGETGFLAAMFRPGARELTERAIVLGMLVPVAMLLQSRAMSRVARLLEDYRKRIGVVARVGSAFVSFDDEEAYARALQAVLETTLSKHGILGYIGGNGDLVCASITRDVWRQCEVPDRPTAFKPDAWGGLWGRALREKRTFYSNEPSRVPAGHIPVSRNLATPVVHNGAVIGLLHVANKPTDYDEKDVGLLEAVAEHIAPILHARLTADTQREACRAAEAELGKLARSHTQLEQTNLRLVEFDRMKSDFLSNVSHELRTPLAAVRAYAESLLEYEIPKEQSRSFLRIILQQSERLTSVLDDLLDLAKIEAGELKLTLEPLEVADAADAAVGSVKPLADGKQIQLSLGTPAAEWSVVADEQRLVQVLVNILNNAVKFTGPGGLVTLSFTPASDAAGTAASAAAPATHLRMTVTDSGEGIPSEDLDRVFDKFKQVADKTKGKRSGTGLGLAICKELVSLMGGRIWAESTVGRGSSFHFTIPLAAGPQPATEETLERETAGVAA
ncbi:MAG: GAF domain-containing sensor histidine kinase [Candidatus Eisenbacteria bacterium]|nr:GAF domain-containing sensor histidine kinase [Candidatus Eisenbacteria bacterium]